jgi:hypothetical protein
MRWFLPLLAALAIACYEPTAPASLDIDAVAGLYEYRSPAQIVIDGIPQDSLRETLALFLTWDYVIEADVWIRAADGTPALISGTGSGRFLLVGDTIILLPNGGGGPDSLAGPRGLFQRSGAVVVGVRIFDRSYQRRD